MSLREEDHSYCVAAVSHFQFCYLRNGIVLGASTPFTIRRDGAAHRPPLPEQKPLFVPSSFEQLSVSRGIPYPYTSLCEATNNLSLETYSKLIQESLLKEEEAVHGTAEGPASLELSVSNRLLSYYAMEIYSVYVKNCFLLLRTDSICCNIVCRRVSADTIL